MLVFRLVGPSVQAAIRARGLRHVNADRENDTEKEGHVRSKQAENLLLIGLILRNKDSARPHAEANRFAGTARGLERGLVVSPIVIVFPNNHHLALRREKFTFSPDQTMWFSRLVKELTGPMKRKNQFHLLHRLQHPAHSTQRVCILRSYAAHQPTQERANEFGPALHRRSPKPQT